MQRINGFEHSLKVLKSKTEFLPINFLLKEPYSYDIQFLFKVIIL